MASGKLSDVRIRTAPTSHKPYKMADGDGLYVRVYPTGRKVFVYRYKVGESERWMELGDYGQKPNLSLKEARTKAEAARVLRREGVDPIEHAEQEREKAEQERRKREAEAAKEKAEVTVKELVDTYYARQIQPRFKRPEEWQRIAYSYVIPSIGNMKVKDVERHHIGSIIDTMVDRGSRVMANRTLPIIKNLFTHAVEKGMIDSNPAAILTRKHAGGKEESRDRNLNLDELRTLLRYVDSEECNVTLQVRTCIKWLALTGQRVGETLLTEWNHLDMEKGFWNIPAPNTKNGKPHLVHMTPQLVGLIDTLKPLTGGSKYVFASDKGPAQPITVRAVSKALLRHFERKELDMPAFTPHDLRRSVASRLSDLGVMPHIIEKILNHEMLGVMAVYNRSDFLAERKKALEMWGSHLEMLTQADTLSNVIQLHAGGAV